MVSRAWFRYCPSVGGGTINPQNYYYTTNIDSCNLGKTICAVYGAYTTLGSGLHPAYFSTRMQIYITNAMSIGTPQPSVNNPYYVLVQQDPPC